MYLAILGYALVVIMMWGLLKGKLIPPVAFCTLPVIFGLLAGFGPKALSEFAVSGIVKTLNATALSMFATTYFAIMTKEGLFDPIVEWLAKRAGGSSTAIMILSVIVASIAHLDTGATSTIYVTIPAMMPLYKKYGMRIEYLFVIVAQAISVINILPHGGGMVRVAGLTGLDVGFMFRNMFPIIICGLVINIIMAVFYGRTESRRLKAIGFSFNPGATNGSSVELVSDTEKAIGESRAQTDTKKARLGARYYINLVLTILILYLMFANVFASYLVFMVGLALALLINYNSLKLQNSNIKELSGNSYMLGITNLSAGFLVGIMGGTGMLTAMANVVVMIIPKFLSGMFAVIVAVTGVPLSICLGGDAFYFGLMPLFVEVANSYSIPTMAIAAVMMLAKDGFSMVTPVSAVTYLAPGLMNMELKDLMKFSMKYLLISYGLKIVLCVLFGIVPVAF
jgi:CitMHS family citrate-Mg2+:H+ or citrate-Ca2+:H+ symporter